MTSFECLVTIGDKKHRIYLPKHINSVKFADIYSHLSQQFNVSLYTHVFEIFDFELNSFTRLASVETPVKYLSRISVSAKSGQNVNNFNTNNSNHYNNNPNNDNMEDTDEFDSNLNNDYFNRDLIGDNQRNEHYFNTGFVGQRRPPVSARQLPPSRRPLTGPVGFIADRYGFESQNSCESEVNEDFYNNSFVDDYSYDDNYGVNDYGMAGPSPPGPHSMPPHGQHYSRRPAFNEPIAGCSRAMPQTYSRDDQLFSRRPNANPNRFGAQQSYGGFGDHYPPADHFEPDYGSYYDKGPQFDHQFGDYQQNAYVNKDFSNRRGMRPECSGSPYDRPSRAKTNPKAVENKQEFDANFNKRKERRKHNLLSQNGFSVEREAGVETYFCGFCELRLQTYGAAVSHISHAVHTNNSQEKHYDWIDRQFLHKLKYKTVKQSVDRRRELRNLSTTDKIKYIRHGIKLKEGTGPKAYVCLTCDQSFATLIDTKIHTQDHEMKLEATKIQESTEDSLLDSAKKQMEIMY